MDEFDRFKIGIIVVQVGFVLALIWAFTVCVGSVSTGLEKMDENGGLKSVIERVWEGKK